MRKHFSHSKITFEPQSMPRRHSFFQRFRSTGKLPVLEDLPPPKKKLLLDLDETLVHHSTFPAHSEIEFFTLPPNDYIYLRPGVREFLTSVMEDFEVFIFTASLPQYANTIMNELFPAIDQEHRICRDKFKVKKNVIKKDIKLLNCSLESVIIVDNSHSVYNDYPSNTIPITTWNGVPHDSELNGKILPILMRCKEVSDVRVVISCL